MTGRKLDKELQRQADEFEQAVLRGTLQSDMLFDALLDKYFSEYAEPQLRERTVYDYKNLPLVCVRLWAASSCPQSNQTI